MSLNTTKTPPKSDLSGSSSKQQGQLTKHDLKQSLESNQKLNNAKNKLVASLADYAGDQEEVMLSMIILTLQMLSQRAAKDPSQLAPSLKHALLDSQGRARTVLPASDLQPIIDRSIEGNHPQVAPDDLVVTVIRTCFVSQDSPTGSFRSSLSPEEKAKEIVKSDFATPYGGRSCLNLIKHIETMRGRYDPRNDYAPVVPIVQSSGSGKSRAVDQLVRSRFPGVTLCFRPPRNTPEWPPRDSDTADFLRQNKVIQAR
ncbi:hypothetical protein IE53DRAFT_35549 [Violaceomyces palustris]|uniref:Uncharacterized protein n=1 Tax=Violaceomyces palustris TaxID=1673888 RepID=A0ACD0P176_9BASI|nr:hypothetical protein IE53DRAFT_35549 [Violaceomyces palustris]